MKKILTALAFCLLMAIPFMGSAQSFNMSKKGVKSYSLDIGGDIPVATLHAVLTEAAPHFGMTPQQMIYLFYTCDCVTVVQTGPNTYLVTYGGLGIEIAIDSMIMDRKNRFIEE